MRARRVSKPRRKCGWHDPEVLVYLKPSTGWAVGLGVGGAFNNMYPRRNVGWDPDEMTEWRQWRRQHGGWGDPVVAEEHVPGEHVVRYGRQRFVVVGANHRPSVNATPALPLHVPLIACIQ